MQAVYLIVRHRVGLHARPAAQFVQTAKQYQAHITIANATNGTPSVNGKSILSVLTRGVNEGYSIYVTAEGPDEADAIEALQALVASNFGEG